MDIGYTLQGIRFELNETKAATDFSKHKISFETACEIFSDPFLIGGESEFVDDESRETVIGATANSRLLYIAYTIRSEIVRIISARFVTKQERNQYENQ